MTEFHAGDAVLFMKVGTHAGEELSKIIARKQQEIDAAGFAMWGYGGNACHPVTMVRPFAERAAQTGAPITLCMHEMPSRHYAQKIRADEYSTDGVTWHEIHPDVHVLGSRYALFIEDLHEVDAMLDLGDTRVALGRSVGRPGNSYVQGRVDKACLDVVENGASVRPLEINLVATIVAPYAALLRNHTDGES